MKKRLISLILAVAIVATMIVMPVGAAVEDAAMATQLDGTCPCGCGKTLSQVNWEPWAANDWTAVSSGHYYLDADYVLADQETIISGKKVVIDLRGHTMSTKGEHRLFHVEGQLSVIDSVGGGTLCAKDTASAYGTVLSVKDNETPDSLLKLYDITVMVDGNTNKAIWGGLIYATVNTDIVIDGCTLKNGYAQNAGAVYGTSGSYIQFTDTTIMDCSATTSGGAVYMQSTAKMEFDGCMILNCSAPTGGAIYTASSQKIFVTDTEIMNCKATTGAGGAISGGTGKATISGSSIIGCSAGTYGGSIFSKGEVQISNSKVWSGTANSGGGNFYVDGGKLTIDNCDVAYGTSGEGVNYVGGGNIYTSGSATLTVKNNSVIRDGYARWRGGNICFVGGVQTFENSTIKGGVTKEYGANIASFDNTSVTTIDGCNISGDVVYRRGKLTLKGATKIGLNSNGLDINATEQTVNATGLTEGAEIFVEANGVFTDAGANKDYFKPAIRTGEITVDETTGGLTATQAASGELGGYCPHCYDAENPQRVTWTAFAAGSGYDSSNSWLMSGHYYGQMNSRYFACENVDFVIDLNGKTSESSQRVIYVNGTNATVSVIDSVGGGKMIGKGASSDPVGGVIYNNLEGFKLNIYGGQMIYKKAASFSATTGCLIRMAGTNSQINVHGGYLDASQQENESGNYAPIFIGNVGTAKQFNMTAGRIQGGKGQWGGNLFVGYYTAVNITGGVLFGGSSVYGGGNIMVLAKQASHRTGFNLKDCAILDGKATGDSYVTTNAAGADTTYTVSGGNIYNAYGSPNIENCYVAGGACTTTTASKGYGGNLSFSGTGTVTISDTYLLNGSTAAGIGGNMNVAGSGITLNMSDSVLVNGTAKASGGNFNSMTVSVVANLTNCRLINGTSIDNNGGNANLNNGKITVKGGAFLHGTAANNGGNIYANAGNQDTAGQFFCATADKANNIDAPVIMGGYAKVSGGNIYVIGDTRLNDASIGAGKAGSYGHDIFLGNGTVLTKLTLNSGVTGKIRMTVASALLTQPVYGEAIAKTVSDGVTADITLEGSYGIPAKVLEKDGTLYAAGAAVVDAKGNMQWHAVNADAVAACGENEYVKLYTDADLAMTKACAVDFNGHSVKVSGTGKISGMDSSGDDFTEPTGGAVGGEAAVMVEAPNGNTYFSITDGEMTTFHRLDMAIYEVVLVPDSQGLYYRGKWRCDSSLADRVSTYGMSVSVNDMPTTDIDASDNVYTELSGSVLKHNSYSTSLLVEKIMKTGNTNAKNKEYGEMEIYATAYIVIDGVTYISDDTTTNADDVHYSLKSFMDTLDQLVLNDPVTYRDARIAVRSFYVQWKDKGMGDWDFARLEPPADPTNDNELNILMVGSSGCYYYVEELYGMLTAAGYDNVRVCNVYYSGCLLSQHYNWWVNGESKYEFFVTDANGRRGIDGVSLEYCLAQYNWDFISLQESGTAKLRVGEAQTLLAERKLYLDTLYPYFRQEFPQAEMLWQENGAYQKGYDKAFKIETTEQQAEDTRHFREFAKAISAAYNVRWIPRGEASQIYRETPGVEDNLCARLAINNGEGDYYHDGDIGGGQYLTASVWFEMLTGRSIIGNTWRPDYELAEEKILLLQECGHQAVENLKAGLYD